MEVYNQQKKRKTNLNSHNIPVFVIYSWNMNFTIAFFSPKPKGIPSL